LGDIARYVITAEADAAAGDKRPSFKQRIVAGARADIDEDRAQLAFVFNENGLRSSEGRSDHVVKGEAASLDQRLHIRNVTLAGADSEHFRSERGACEPARVLAGLFAIDRVADGQGVDRHMAVGRRSRRPLSQAVDKIFVRNAPAFDVEVDAEPPAMKRPAGDADMNALHPFARHALGLIDGSPQRGFGRSKPALAAFDRSAMSANADDLRRPSPASALRKVRDQANGF
jgi:hypothetical protein